MIQRIAGWSLVLVFAAQLVNLWPLPQHVAEQRIAFWTKSKAYWEGTDPSKSENPEWTATAKVESLSRIDEALADTDGIVYGARVEWALWFLSTLATGAAAVAGLRVSRHWRWFTLVSFALFMWLQQPWHVLGFFVSQGQVDITGGIQQLKFIGHDFPGTLSTMLVLNVVVPIVLFTVAGYAVLQLARQRRDAL